MPISAPKLNCTAQAGGVGYSRCREQCNQAIGLGRALREGVCEGKGEKRRLPLLHSPGQSSSGTRSLQWSSESACSTTIVSIEHTICISAPQMLSELFSDLPQLNECAFVCVCVCVCACALCG